MCRAIASFVVPLSPAPKEPWGSDDAPEEMDDADESVVISAAGWVQSQNSMGD